MSKPFEDYRDELLDEQHRITPGLALRIQSSLGRYSAMPQPLQWVLSSFARAAFATALPLALGFAAGIFQYEANDLLDEQVVMLAFGDTFEE